MSLALIFVILALVLTLFELTIRSNYRAPIVWAILLIAMALLLPATRAVVVP